MIWRTNILSDSGAGNLPWGMAAAPLVVGDATSYCRAGRGTSRWRRMTARPESGCG